MPSVDKRYRLIEMEENMNSENAIEIRDEIFALEKLKQKYTTQFSKLINQDVIVYSFHMKPDTLLVL